MKAHSDRSMIACKSLRQENLENPEVPTWLCLVYALTDRLQRDFSYKLPWLNDGVEKDDHLMWGHFSLHDVTVCSVFDVGSDIFALL